MAPNARRRSIPLGVVARSLGLVALALLLLAAGGFVQFGATGLAGASWRFVLGPLALVAVILAVVTSWPESKARLSLGIALALVFAGVAWQGLVNENFRFVWLQGKGEFVVLELLVGLIAFVLIATGVQADPYSSAEPPTAQEQDAPGAGRWLLRWVAYVGGAVVVMFVAFFIGLAAAPRCDDDFGDCDLVGVYGAVYSLFSLPVSAVVITVVESIRTARRSRRPAA